MTDVIRGFVDTIDIEDNTLTYKYIDETHRQYIFQREYIIRVTECLCNISKTTGKLETHMDTDTVSPIMSFIDKYIDAIVGAHDDINVPVVKCITPISLINCGHGYYNLEISLTGMSIVMEEAAIRITPIFECISMVPCNIAFGDIDLMMELPEFDTRPLSVYYTTY